MKENPPATDIENNEEPQNSENEPKMKGIDEYVPPESRQEERATIKT